MTDYTLYYWPIPFRGHFIRYILAHAGATWDEPGADALVAVKDAPVADQPYPFMAPPLLRDNDTGEWLSQMPAIAMYLGRRHGLIEAPDQTLRLLCDASDILFEITRYHGALMWDRDSWRTFAETRLPRWMQMHDRLLRQNRAEAARGFALGTPAPTLADLTLTALWHTMVDRLPPLRPLLATHAPVVEGLTGRIAATPRIAEMRAGWPADGPRYCGGQIEASLMAMLKG